MVKWPTRRCTSLGPQTHTSSNEQAASASDGISGHAEAQSPVNPRLVPSCRSAEIRTSGKSAPADLSWEPCWAAMSPSPHHERGAQDGSSSRKRPHGSPAVQAQRATHTCKESKTSRTTKTAETKVASSAAICDPVEKWLLRCRHRLGKTTTDSRDTLAKTICELESIPVNVPALVRSRVGAALLAACNIVSDDGLRARGLRLCSSWKQAWQDASTTARTRGRVALLEHFWCQPDLAQELCDAVFASYSSSEWAADLCATPEQSAIVARCCDLAAFLRASPALDCRLRNGILAVESVLKAFDSAKPLESAPPGILDNGLSSSDESVSDGDGEASAIDEDERDVATSSNAHEVPAPKASNSPTVAYFADGEESFETFKIKATLGRKRPRVDGSLDPAAGTKASTFADKRGATSTRTMSHDDAQSVATPLRAEVRKPMSAAAEAPSRSQATRRTAQLDARKTPPLFGNCPASAKHPASRAVGGDIQGRARGQQEGLGTSGQNLRCQQSGGASASSAANCESEGSCARISSEEVLAEIARILAVPEGAQNFGTKVLQLSHSVAGPALSEAAAKAFRRLARRIHPDGRSLLSANDEMQCHEAMARLQRARNAVRRRAAGSKSSHLPAPTGVKCVSSRGVPGQRCWIIEWLPMPPEVATQLSHFELRAFDGKRFVTVAAIEPSYDSRLGRLQTASELTRLQVRECELRPQVFVNSRLTFRLAAVPVSGTGQLPALSESFTVAARAAT